MTDKQFIDSMIQKLKEAKQSEDIDHRETKIREVMIHTRMQVEDKKFSDLIKEKLEKQEPSVTLERLEERADQLEESLELWEKDSEEAEQPYFGVYSDEGLKMLEYEISRLKKLDKRDRL